MENINLLQIDEMTRQEIQEAAEKYDRFLGLKVSILEVGIDFITVRITIGKKTEYTYQPKELVEKAKEVFSSLPNGLYQIRVRPPKRSTFKIQN